MTWYQKEINLPPKSRGFHLITRDIEGALPRLRDFQVGLAHIFIRHTFSSDFACSACNAPGSRLNAAPHSAAPLRKPLRVIDLSVPAVFVSGSKVKYGR